MAKLKAWIGVAICLVARGAWAGSAPDRALDAVVLVVDRSEIVVWRAPKPEEVDIFSSEADRYTLEVTGRARSRLEPALFDSSLWRGATDVFCAPLRELVPTIKSCEVVEPGYVLSALHRAMPSSTVALVELEFGTPLNFATLSLYGTLQVGAPHEEQAKLVDRDFKVRVASDISFGRGIPARLRESMVDRWLSDGGAPLRDAVVTQLRDYVQMIAMLSTRKPERWCDGERAELHRVDGYKRGWLLAVPTSRAYLLTETESVLAVASDSFSRRGLSKAKCPAM